MGVAVDGNGNVYVADRLNNRVEVFTESGTYLTQWRQWGDPAGGKQFNGPHGVAVDGNGNVYVTDYSCRVVVFGSLPTPTKSTSWGQLKAKYAK